MSTSTLTEFAAEHGLDQAEPGTIAEFNRYCAQLAHLEAVITEAFEEVKAPPLIFMGKSPVPMVITPNAIELLAPEGHEGLPNEPSIAGRVPITPKQYRACLVMMALHLLECAIDATDAQAADAMREEAWTLLDEAGAHLPSPHSTTCNLKGLSA